MATKYDKTENLVESVDVSALKVPDVKQELRKHLFYPTSETFLIF